MSPHDVAINILGPIDWIDVDVGYCQCPGETAHSNKNGKRHCRVYLDEPANIHCVHSSCKGIRDEVGKQLRKAMRDGNPDYKPRPIDPAILEAKRAKMREFEHWSKWAESSRDVIFKKYQWNETDAYEESPTKSETEEGDYGLYLSLFNPGSIVWIGEPTDSGKHAADHFKSAKDWSLKNEGHHFTAPVVWKPGAINRSNANVYSRPFLVVESDTLDFTQTCSLAKWMSSFLELRMMLYSGGKSIHCWFDMPSILLFERLKIILPALGADPALFKPSQPVRCPGVKRGDKWQSIIYFRPNNLF